MPCTPDKPTPYNFLVPGRPGHDTSELVANKVKLSFKL